MNDYVHIVDFNTGEYYTKAGTIDDWSTNPFLAGEFEPADAEDLVRLLRSDDRLPITCEI